MGIITARQKDYILDGLNKIERFTTLAVNIEKVNVVEELVSQKNISFANIYYLGDEVFDIPLLEKCELLAAPESAARDVKRVVKFTIDSRDTKYLFKELFNLMDIAK